MKDVAEHAGVSVATVSKYVNGGNVLERNQKKIRKAIDELNYKVNRIARSLKTDKTMTIGVLIPDFKNIFFTNIISYIEDILQKSGYSTFICEYKDDKRVEKEKINFFIDKMVDGIILVPHDNEIEEIDKIKEEDISLLLLDRMISGVECDMVLTDSVDGSYNAVKHFIQHGHKKIGIITGPEDIYTSRQRLKGYKKAHKNYNIKINSRYIRFSNYEVLGGYGQTKKIWKQEDPPTALFICNYEMTIGALIAVNEMKINIPRDLSLIGFDDIMQLSRVFKPSLSIVSQPMEEIGETAANLLLKRLSGDYSNYPEHIKLRTEVLKKDSVYNLNDQKNN
ncbi:MAG: LacI family DNA-binding transcriptional regulator [Halanaerobiaceae bacterium]